jgi:hypothetical protein
LNVFWVQLPFPSGLASEAKPVEPTEKTVSVMHTENKVASLDFINVPPDRERFMKIAEFCQRERNSSAD